MSFEYYGGFIAHDLITRNGGSKGIAESVTEAIIRHQDFIQDGMITTVGQLVQIATSWVTALLDLVEIDNMGSHAELIHPETITDISAKYPRNKWT
jgi:cyanamide hydratase